jgi:uncharacterized protein
MGIRDSFLSESTLFNGARIWLSGSLPESEDCPQKQRDAILEFVNIFAAKVFRLGGHIIHGSHPSFTPSLLHQAEEYQKIGGKKDCLTLYVSRYFSKNRDEVPVDTWRNTCTVYETPADFGEIARDESLNILRNWMASCSDAIVVVGGKWWKTIGGQSGIPIELDFAIKRNIPCFLLGGLGGATKDYIAQHPEFFALLRNGFDVSINRALSSEKKVGKLAQVVCDQLRRLPLVHGRGEDGSSFRILALDGGGIRGTFTASALATWEQYTGLRLVDHFDLIAGTSTGGIIAIGLGLELSAKQILDFYRNRGPVIFPLTSFSRRLRYTLRHIFQPKYSQETLLRELESAYYSEKKMVTLKSSKCRLVIPAYHAIAGVSHVFRTPHSHLFTLDAEIPAAEAALATAAAPTFFSAANVGNMIAESKFFDGGVWANSPAMAAIVEAVCFLGVPLDRIDVLSVGTTEEPFTLRKQTKAGFLRWSKKLIRLLMNAQEESCLKQAKLLAGEPRFLRVNTVTYPGCYNLDNPQNVSELAALGNNKALEPEILGQIKSRFLNNVHVNPWK